MEDQNPYKPPISEDELDAFLSKYEHAATNVLRCKTGQEGIVRYLEHVEGFSHEESTRLSYSLYDRAKSRLRRTQIPKLVISLFLLAIGFIGPVVLYFLEFGFVVISGMPIIAGWALLQTVIWPHPLENNDTHNPKG